MLQGAWTFGQAMNDADLAVGNTASRTRPTSAPIARSPATTPPHKLALAGVWEMPFLKDSTGWQKGLLGGWQLAGSAIFQTGTPINVTHGGAFPTGDFNADGAGGDRPNAPAAGVKTVGWSQRRVPDRHLPRQRLPADRRAGQNGNLPRNAYRGPGYADVSLSFSKKFAVSQTASAEFRIDAFNAFNRVNLVGSEHGSEQHELRQVDVAARAAGDSARA